MAEPTRAAKILLDPGPGLLIGLGQQILTRAESGQTTLGLENFPVNISNF